MIRFYHHSPKETTEHIIQVIQNIKFNVSTIIDRFYTRDVENSNCFTILI